MMLARLTESTDLVPTYTRPDGSDKSSRKEQWQLPVLPSLGRVAPSPALLALTLKLFTLVPPLSLLPPDLELRVSEFVST